MVRGKTLTEPSALFRPLNPSVVFLFSPPSGFVIRTLDTPKEPSILGLFGTKNRHQERGNAVLICDVRVGNEFFAEDEE